MKYSATKLILTIALSVLYCLSFAGGPPALYPTTSTSNAMNPSETLEITGKLKIGNASGPVSTADRLLVRGPSGEIMDRYMPPFAQLVLLNPGTPSSLFGWEVSGNNVYNIGKKVGINKTSPLERLHVGGNILSEGSVDASQYLLNGNPFREGKWLTNGSNIYYDAGNVGIGTNSPSSALEVVGQLTVNNRIKVGTSSLILESDSAGGILNSIYTDGGNDLFIQCQSSSNTIMGTKSDSRVGIGTTNPQKKLHIKTFHEPEIPTPGGGGTGSHYGIRLEDVFTTTIGSPPDISVWDIEPIFDGISRLDFGIPGNPMLSITDQGKVGIGTTSPSRLLHLQSAGNPGLRIEDEDDGRPGLISVDNSVLTLWMAGSGTGTGDILFRTGGGSGLERMVIQGTTGKVGIGTSLMPGDYLLYVKGGILTEKIKAAGITSGDWGDFVFQADYKLMSLKELEKYVGKHKHLPGVPSADEVVENGIEMVKMDATLLIKIEELTLYVIAQQKEIDQLKKDIKK